MALPKIQQPLFSVTLPSNDKEIQFRPFTVKEEKVLLIAQAANDVKTAIDSIKQIISNCVVTEGFDVETIPMFDMEFLLIHIRARSVSNTIEFQFNDPEQDEPIKMEIDLDEIKISRNEEHNKNIQLDDDHIVVMKYPNINDLFKLEGVEEDKVPLLLFDMMLDCIETLVKGEEVYTFSEFPQEDVKEFVESLTSEQVKKIETFFNTAPRIKLEKLYRLKNGKEKKFVAEGHETFFI